MFEFLRVIIISCIFVNASFAMDETSDGIWASSFFGTMKLWKNVAPVVAEVSEKIVSLSRTQNTQLPFLGGPSSLVETMIIPTVLEHTRSTIVPSPRTEAYAEHTQQTIAALRSSVAKKTQENQSLKDALDRKDRELRELQYKLGLATGEIRLSPSEGGPSEK